MIDPNLEVRENYYKCEDCLVVSKVIRTGLKSNKGADVGFWDWYVCPKCGGKAKMTPEPEEIS